jgi:putative hydrolase of the HAD superfamily
VISTTVSRPRPLAVSFDVGGTLIEPWPSVGHVYATVAAGFGLAGLEPAVLNRGFATAWKRRAGHDYSRAAWQSLVNETFLLAGAAPPSDECFHAFYRRFEQADVWRVFEDVLPTLEALRARGIRLAVISNWDERLRPLLEALELAGWFEVVVVSHEFGQVKPAPDIFLHAAAQLKLPPEVVVHVGDGVREDEQGALHAGMGAALLDRAANKAGARAISTLSSLPELLEAFSHGALEN